MSLAFLLREAKTFDQRYALVKAVYDIKPNFGELENLQNYMISDKDWSIYEEVKIMLSEFKKPTQPQISPIPAPKQPLKLKSNIPATPTQSISPQASDLLSRLETFKTKCEEVIQAYESMHTSHTAPYKTLWGPKLEIKMGQKYAKLQGLLKHGVHTYTFAVVDITNGNIYRPTSAHTGTINIKTAKVKGNIYDADYGMKNIDHNGPKIESNIN